jgi:pimeloyl-ACP methyl ester carboxylesterase
MPRRAIVVAASSLVLTAVVSTTAAGAAGSPEGPKPSTTLPSPVQPAPAVPAVPTTLPPAAALQWGACEDDVDPEFECATMTVPLDYANPTGQQIGIAVIRLPAASGRREGAVLLNPGGPGGSGYDFAANASVVLDRELGLDGRFDLIGFDPRGVDRSGGLRCQTDAEIDLAVYFDDTPDSPEEAAQLDALDRAFGSACVAKYGDTLRHYSTDNTARDMDMIRAALGDPQISYLGISYGTFLGAIYATLFPNNVRAMVLDSASERTGETSLQGTVTQLGGFEGAFANWAAWCEEGTECAFTDLDVAARWDRLYASLDARPVKSDRGQAVNQVVLMTATIASMYNELSWPALGTALAEAESGDGTALLALSDEYNGRREDGTYETIFQANPVISCASGLQQPDPRDPAVLLAELQAAAPRFSRGIGISDMRDTCLDFLAQNPLPTIPSYAGTAPVLVVGGLNDPATPFRWAEEMTAMMGPSAVLLTFTGEGHGQVLSSNCVTEIEGAVLSGMRLPQPGASCDPDPDVPRPAFWDQIPVPAGVGPLVADPTIDLALGLPPTEMYADVWFLTGDPAAVEAAYRTALQGLNFNVLPSDTTALAGATVIPTLAPDNTEVLVVIIPPAALSEDGDFAEAAPLAPEGQGFVIVLAFPPA